MTATQYGIDLRNRRLPFGWVDDNDHLRALPPFGQSLTCGRGSAPNRFTVLPHMSASRGPGRIRWHGSSRISTVARLLLVAP